MAAKLVDAVMAIIRRGNRFLFVKRSEVVLSAVGYWTPVGGHIEANESQEDALRREVFEEVGLEIEPIAKVAQVPSPDGRYLLHYWTVEIRAGEARIANEEATEMRWVTLEELTTLSPTFEDDVRVIAEFGA